LDGATTVAHGIAAIRKPVKPPTHPPGKQENGKRVSEEALASAKFELPVSVSQQTQLGAELVRNATQR
jgi:hypothetical protein